MQIGGHKIAVELLAYDFFVGNFQRASNFLSRFASKSTSASRGFLLQTLE
jgi:hypothetical protein